MQFTHRIMALPVLTAVVLAIVFGVAFMNVREGTDLIRRLQDELFAAVDLSRRLELDAVQLNHDLDAAISVRDVDLVHETEAVADRIRAGLDQARELPGLRGERVSALVREFERYDALARRVALDLIAVDGIPAERLLADAERMRASFESLRDGLEALTTAQVVSVRGELRTAAERFRSRLQLITLLGLGTVVLLVLMAMLAIVSIVRPLRKLRAATAAIARGDLDAPLGVDVSADDDLGQLAQSFREMQRALEADIAHREEVEHALRESEERLGLALDAANDGIWDIDLDAGSFYTSDRFAAILGYTPDEKPRTYEQLRAMLVGVDDRELARLFREEHGDDREVAFEVRMTRKDGGEAWVEIKGRAVSRHPDGRPARLVGTISDITSRKAAEEELHRAQDRLMQSEKLASLGRLVAGLVHELNSPLGTLVASSDLTARSARALRDQDTVDPARRERALTALGRSVESTAAAASRLQDLLGGLKQFTALDRAERQEADLHELIEATLTVMGRAVPESITVVRDFGDLPRIVCYPGQLNQLLLALLRNAVEAMEGGGTLTLRTRDRGDGSVGIAVVDTGRGIPAHELSRLFEPHFRQGSGRVHLGWGLVTASRIATEHGGRITVDSEPGVGSTFTVVLPVRPGAFRG
ncbi:PAS domain S-box protein [bacterium]|nr:PAS domain S-box protein [bacterium]